MPDTKLLIFGSPAGGTPVTLAAPLAALDLPLKVLIWDNPAGGSFVSYAGQRRVRHPAPGEPLSCLLAAITVSRCHLILVIRSPGELADLEHVQAEPLDLCEHVV